MKTHRELGRVATAESQFRFDLRRKKRNISARGSQQGRYRFRHGWIQHSKSIISNQSLSISQLCFHPLAGLDHVVIKVTNSSFRLLFCELNNYSGRRMSPYSSGESLGQPLIGPRWVMCLPPNQSLRPMRADLLPRFFPKVLITRWYL